MPLGQANQELSLAEMYFGNNKFKKNKENTLKKYSKLLKMGGKYPFLELIKNNHLLNPFIDGNIKKIMKPSIKQLNSINDLKF